MSDDHMVVVLRQIPEFITHRIHIYKPNVGRYTIDYPWIQWESRLQPTFQTIGTSQTDFFQVGGGFIQPA